MCIDMDDDYIISGSSDETVRVWRILTADCEHVFSDNNIKMGEVVCDDHLHYTVVMYEGPKDNFHYKLISHIQDNSVNCTH